MEYTEIHLLSPDPHVALLLANIYFKQKKTILFLKRSNEVSTVVCDFLGAKYVWNKVMKMKATDLFRNVFYTFL